MNNINTSLLPSGSSIDHAGLNITPRTQERLAKEELQAKVTRIMDKFTRDGNIVILSARVQKVRSLLESLRMNAPHLTECFENAVMQKEQAAHAACQIGRFDSAFTEFSLLEQALRYEQGSDRYFFIQASSLGILVRQEKIGEAITQLLHLEKVGIPDAFATWHDKVRRAIIDYVQTQFAENERALELIRDKIEACSKQISKILSKESLAEDKSLGHYLSLLYPVQENLDVISKNLTACKERFQTLAEFYRQLQLDPVSHCDNVSALFDNWNALSKSAIELLGALNQANSTEDKNGILREWITSKITSYECAAQNLSALHGWALSLLGKLYFSNDLSEDALQASVVLVRTYAATLFTHLRAFPCDVQLRFGTRRIEISLLVLAAISQRLQNDYCSHEHISSLRAFSFGALLHSLPYIGRKGEPEKPTVDLNDLIEQTVEHTKDAEGLLNALLTAFAKNAYRFDLSPEDTVALFEIAYDLLEMPPEIADLSINPLHTTELENQLTAILWLRLVQARRLSLPYPSLEQRLLDVRAQEFLQWISLYDPSRTGVDNTQHHRLFFAIAQAAERLMANKLMFNEKNIADIWSFLVGLYDHLLQLNVDLSIKNTLDTKLIQFGARCVARASNAVHYSAAGSLATLAYLDAQALSEIADICLVPQVRGWLEKFAFPKLTTLVLHKGLYSDNLGDFTKCKALTSLTMPLTGENSEREVEVLAREFPALNTLVLHDGNVSVKSLNAQRLSSLSLRGIGNLLDFSGCKTLHQNLEYLSLVDVRLEPNALSWVASSKRLTTLSICAAQGATIGCLALQKQTHAHPTLRSVSLKVDCIDDDEALLQSLPMLIDSHSTLASIALFTESRDSLLELLLRAPKAASVQELTISCNHAENLGLLSQFTHLKRLTFHTDDQAQVMRIKEFDFSECRKLPEYSIVGSPGHAMYVPIRK